jgi:hypothetical protein
LLYVSTENTHLCFAHSGNFAISLNASSSNSNDPCIIDSRASNHITGLSTLLFPTLCSRREKVRITDNFFSYVPDKGDKGSTSITPISLRLFYMYLSWQPIFLLLRTLTRTKSCNVLFYPYYCLFQELIIGKMIARGSMMDGLYYLNSQLKEHIWIKQVHQATLSENFVEMIWLRHQRLRNPFLLLQQIFPSLFSQINVF